MIPNVCPAMTSCWTLNEHDSFGCWHVDMLTWPTSLSNYPTGFPWMIGLWLAPSQHQALLTDRVVTQDLSRSFAASDRPAHGSAQQDALLTAQVLLMQMQLWICHDAWHNALRARYASDGSVGHQRPMVGWTVSGMKDLVMIDVVSNLWSYYSVEREVEDGQLLWEAMSTS